MLRDITAAGGLHRRFLLQVILPLLLVLAMTGIGGLYAIHWAAARSDAASMEQQHHLLEVALSDTLAHLATQQRSVALWRPLAEVLAAPRPDLAFLDENIGGWLHEMFGHDATYVLGPRDAGRYVSQDGLRQGPDAFAAVEQGLAPLLDALKRESTMLGRQAGPSAGGAADGNVVPATAQVETMQSLLGRPAFVAAARIPRLDVTSAAEFSTEREFFSIVSVIFLDAGYLRELGARTNLADLRLADPEDALAPTEAALTLHAPSGEPLGRLVWRADRPGSEMQRALIPTALGMLAVVTLIFGLMARRLWRSLCGAVRILRELRASEAQAQHLAFHDVLTGLPNRALFDDRLGQALAQVQRESGRIALLLLDLDRFKHVNDTMGHHAGDILIREIATRLANQMRDADTVARVGGDEFMIVLAGVESSADADARCDAIQAAIRRPCVLLGNPISPSATIGYALAPDDGAERGELMRKADIALYAAKAAGRDTWRRFEQSMDDTVRMRNDISTDLRAALEHQQGLAVHFQPQVDGASRKVVGLEALVRWQHQRRGTIRPDEFIPIAEETGLIVPLGEWVFRQACRTARRWPQLFMAVNVSPVQFRNATLAQRLIAIAREEQCDPAQIELEITEGVLLEDDQRAHTCLAELRQAGFKIALDDFGTGYSSLHYLQRFRVDKIKIDRSFTQSLGACADAPAIIDSVVGLGRAMGLTITAEGVETQEQMQALVAAGCHELQGYLFSLPLPEDRLEEAIANAGQDGTHA
ncbi:bifunctional diguanylate cyclase/phosphodiesterase [Cupriavidus sp. AU9028]|uniref:putative bifunctional diguanylate cyclase/phosphodiesterase n=1 Tax=Cupriavidus sp. AU9028 TaxID=2871157 RepID=UPI001C955A27|nr:bifunctional diguanylate cyclase/phosphodiesterase [Cupriavidus sp. AU9028]MBY4897964.1 bifunctional diguanylate cyclase/phosphodiesterase [Cupriavidus sp. AU9028]